MEPRALCGLKKRGSHGGTATDSGSSRPLCSPPWRAGLGLALHRETLCIFPEWFNCSATVQQSLKTHSSHCNDTDKKCTCRHCWIVKSVKLISGFFSFILHTILLVLVQPIFLCKNSFLKVQYKSHQITLSWNKIHWVIELSWQLLWLYEWLGDT